MDNKNDLSLLDILSTMPNLKSGAHTFISLPASTSVLYVEDNRCNQALASQIFKNLGCKLKVVNNGAEAIDILQRESFHIILMDINMPLMDGYECTRIIRNSISSSVPIIACTTSVHDDEIKQCLEAGMNDHIGKPYTQDQIWRALFTWISRQ